MHGTGSGWFSLSVCGFYDDSWCGTWIPVAPMRDRWKAKSRTAALELDAIVCDINCNTEQPFPNYKDKMGLVYLSILMVLHRTKSIRCMLVKYSFLLYLRFSHLAD